MSHSFRELFYHLIWSTKNREPVTIKASGLGCRIFALNCVSDHVHLLLYIPPNLVISKAINSLKGASSHELKGLSPEFYWQQGYGILHYAVQIYRWLNHI